MIDHHEFVIYSHNGNSMLLDLVHK